MKKKYKKWFINTAMIFGSIGALTWGTVELFDFNIISSAFGSISWLQSSVYYLIALGGIMGLYKAFK